jgi:phage host-nuclease inhibitor protein Gam
MNEARRKEIEAVKAALVIIQSAFQDSIAQLKADYETRLEEVKGEIETIRDAEQEYYDNMPESFQSGEKGERTQEAIDALESAISDLEIDLLDGADLNIDDTLSSLDTATQ